jgi:hypothetical protein
MSSFIPLRLKETSACWNLDDKDSFQKNAKAGIIGIDNTTPAYIESIRVKYWGGKKVETFCTNFWTTAADLQVERETKGQRAGKSYLCISTQPYPTLLPVVLSDAAHTATATTTTNNNGGDNEDNDEDNDCNDDDDDDDDDNKKLPTLPAMSSKITTASSAAAAKSGNVVDDLSACFQKAGVSSPKNAAFTTYSTKVADPILVCTFLESGKFFVDVDMNIAAALTYGDRIKATLTPGSMGISFQRGVYVSFFGNRRLRRDLGNAISKILIIDREIKYLDFVSGHLASAETQ